LKLYVSLLEEGLREVKNYPFFGKEIPSKNSANVI
jgi:hypothetical protein